MKLYTRLPIKNANNVRELGGYPAKGGVPTKYGSFLRADDLTKLDKNDIQFLLDYGVVAVIDLRSDAEIVMYPDPFANTEKVNYVHIPFIEQDVIDPSFYRTLMLNPSTFLTEMYIDIVKNASLGIRKVFEFIASQEGGILFHCTAGKDRTGIVAMLLLGLVGVSKEDIISNYMVTEIYIKDSLISKEGIKDFPKELGMSKPEYIEPVIDYIVENYGGFEKYLLQIGIEERILEVVKEKLISYRVQVGKWQKNFFQRYSWYVKP